MPISYERPTKDFMSGRSCESFHPTVSSFPSVDYLYKSTTTNIVMTLHYNIDMFKKDMTEIVFGLFNSLFRSDRKTFETVPM